MFDPDATGVANGAYFGFEFDAGQSAVTLISVPWDVTVSYRDGSARAPYAIIAASTQVEIHDADFENVWQKGIYTMPIDSSIEAEGAQMRAQARKVIDHIECGGSETDEIISAPLSAVNNACRTLHQKIYDLCCAELDAGRRIGLIGGDHSTPLGLIRALSERHTGLGILHIDAHADLRDSYEGFEFSHASIMYNVLKTTNIERLTQVAVRDFCQAESDFARFDKRITQFTDSKLSENEFKGETWDEQCDKIIATLPKKVYISFDIDGLDRAFCPTTGTPVPGGISYQKAVYLLLKLHHSGRNVVGFDLNEVAPNITDEWDAIVGARLLYKLCLILCH